MARGELFHVKHFTVEGVGEFPLDMLRYDRCWPKTGFDVDRMALDHSVTRAVELVTHRRPQQEVATIDRWHSFGWTVVMIHGKAV